MIFGVKTMAIAQVLIIPAWIWGIGHVAKHPAGLPTAGFV
jgi:hypothetical protein